MKIQKSLILVGTMTMVFSACIRKPNSEKEVQGGKAEIVEIDDGCFANSSKYFDYFKAEKRGEGQTVVTASAPIANFYSIEKLSTSGDYDLSHRTLNLSIDSLDAVGLMTIDLDLVDEESDESDIFERIYAFPTINPETGERDVKLDIYGNEVMASSVSPNRENPSFEITPDSFTIDRPLIDIGLRTDVLYPIVSLTLDLVSLSTAQTMAADFVTVPALSLTNPLPYFFYTAKVELAKSHFDHNVSQTNQPTEGYIEDQYWYENFKFGLTDSNFGELISPNIKTAGCGIVAAFNMLRDSHANINFPALIALYELCGADLLFGYLGVNPVPNYYDTVVIPAASASLLAVYGTVLQPLLNLALSLVEPMLFALCSWTPLDLIIPGASLTAAVAAAATIRVIINDSGRAVSEFLNWYSVYSKSQTEMLQLFYGDRLLDFPIGSFSAYKSMLSMRSQAIVCFWNQLNESRGIDFIGGAHYVYLKSIGEDPLEGVLFQSHNNWRGEDSYNAFNIQNFFGDDHDSSQYIWGYILSY